jgi:phage antirepressor YoqD-like protein
MHAKMTVTEVAKKLKLPRETLRGWLLKAKIQIPLNETKEGMWKQ